MAFKDVLLTLTTYPGPTPVSAVDAAIALSGALGARISAIACEVEVQPPGRISVFTDSLLDIPAMVKAVTQTSAKNARDLHAAFEASARQQGILQDIILERCLTSEVPNIVVEYARLRDLTIVPVPEGDHVETWYAESIIFGAGRPVIVLPASPKQMPAQLDRVVVAWDFSRPAARALADALPILEKAKEVRVVTVTSEKVIDSSRSGEELAKYLSRHGVTTILEKIPSQGSPVQEALESYCESRHSDILVMGAYGHSRMREFILGGATRSMLLRPPLPILLSY